VLNSPKGVFFTRINPLDTEACAFQRRLVNACVDTFARKPANSSLNQPNLPLIPSGLFLFAPSP
jgi:hypothetical protein